MHDLTQLITKLKSQYPQENKFIQAVDGVFSKVSSYLAANEIYFEKKILERMVEPERLLKFKVVWRNDAGDYEVNRGWRVQFNGALGPYKGGLRFHPSVTEDTLKFLAFEQTFKNALTGLNIGGAKGGSDFNPRGRSDSEVHSFCQAFMDHLHTFIGPSMDVPAGDIGVGARELGFLFGHYRSLNRQHQAALTGKGTTWGGSCFREEATGYGLLYFVEAMLEEQDKVLSDQRVLISGSGNVALHAAEKAIAMGCQVLTLSDSDGYIFVEKGLTEEQLAAAKRIKLENRGRIHEVADQYDGITYHENQSPWTHHADIALPCATQNEIGKDEAKCLVNHGIHLVAEGANMPCTSEAQSLFQRNDVFYAPGKASNAGGVSVSVMEMQQNALFTAWSQQEVDSKTKEIMRRIYQRCRQEGGTDGLPNLLRGATISAFKRVANAMIAQGT